VRRGAVAVAWRGYWLGAPVADLLLVQPRERPQHLHHDVLRAGLSETALLQDGLEEVSPPLLHHEEVVRAAARLSKEADDVRVRLRAQQGLSLCAQLRLRPGRLLCEVDHLDGGRSTGGAGCLVDGGEAAAAQQALNCPLLAADQQRVLQSAGRLPTHFVSGRLLLCLGLHASTKLGQHSSRIALCDDARPIRLGFEKNITWAAIFR
jgi:hypothetical protein